MREYKFKNKYFWTMATSTDCSWSMKGIMKNHKKARDLIRYVVANGENTYL